jgi:sec-independent protein translocase protein TatA
VPFVPNIGGPELIIILVIVLLLFGAKRIPELAKGLGSGVREFRKSSSGDYDKEEEENREKPELGERQEARAEDESVGDEERVHEEENARSERSS